MPEAATASVVRRVHEAIGATHPQIADVFANAYPNPLETSFALQNDGTTFVLTGDIPAMWPRDSVAQVRPYVGLAAHDDHVRSVIRGLIRRCARNVALDPYANAFNVGPNGNCHARDETEMSPWVWERKWELDSLCYPILLLRDWMEATDDASVFDRDVHRMLRLSVDTMRTEQQHAARSAYRFRRTERPGLLDNLPNDGAGAPVAETGMVWVGFRPSDDACALPYHVPSNMFAAAILPYAAGAAREHYADESLARGAEALAAEIEAGIERHAVVEDAVHGRAYAYETDGRGNHVMIDDANVPSLLSVPYLGYRAADDATYRATRASVLSEANPYFYAGATAAGIGSPHTPAGHVWPIGLSMQALTAAEPAEAEALLTTLAATTGGTNLMHESFHVDDPTHFTRPWFGWANSLFCEAVLAWLERTGR